MRVASSVTCIVVLHMLAAPARSGQNMLGNLPAGGCRGFRDAKVRGTAGIFNQCSLWRGFKVTPPPFGLQLRGGGGGAAATAEEGEDGEGGEGGVCDVDMGEATARATHPPGGQGGGQRAVDVQAAGSQPGDASPQGDARKFAKVCKGDLDGDEYVEMMAVCVEEVGQGRADIPDGYAIVEEAREAGRNVTLELLNELLKVCAEAAKSARAGTRDGERVFEEIEREGLKPNNETYEIMLDLIANGAAHGPQTAYLSDAYSWLTKMVDDMGLTQKAVDNYMKCYNNQWPNVVETNSMEANWCFLDDQEEKLWIGDPAIGLPPDPSADYSRYVHWDDLPELRAQQAAADGTRSDSTPSDDSDYFPSYSNETDLTARPDEVSRESERAEFDYDQESGDTADHGGDEQDEGDDKAFKDPGSSSSEDGLPTGPIPKAEYLNTPRGAERHTRPKPPKEVFSSGELESD